ncbi:carbohydrate kinase family protein [Pseudaestuariivita atlantica]|uniref:Carbohydrate kinase n=1 Tax=Pseudaestuariivita atlantica TaxID=1317121 RepID=A0A0L1JPT1_9RHOB|nr:carbohydrate kinase [Pseudaestuariivita atlantica]KNG93741.1 carbohydrate kinase [Pseudaestuariivita atlantica]
MILCCGEALIDMVPRKTAEGEDAFLPLPGGAVYNTALSLGRLGARVGFFSGLSTDVFGRKLRAFHEESDVDTSRAAMSDRPTTLAIVELKDGHATYSFMDENSAGRMLSVSDIPDITGVSTLYFGGISLCAEPAASVYAEMCTRYAADHVVMIDPNIRPGFITDEPAYRARIERMLAVSDIVKVSDEDLDWLYPGAGPQRILELGPKLVLMTKGADGAEAHRAGGGMVSVPGVPATVVDTVGAGDTFNAGVLASLQQAGALTKTAIADLPDETLADALALGAKVASVTVSRAGANPPWASELK